MPENHNAFPSPPQQTAAPSDAPLSHTSGSWAPLLEFRGKGSELFWIYLKNICFTILTLGVYSFWAKVRVREYLWNNTFLWGEPFEYTGTGKELFISFLIVLPAFIAFTFLYQWLINIVPIFAIIAMPLLLFFLVYFAVYRTIRYRLTRTKWRGIRGNLGGSAVKFACMATLYMIIGICSLGLLMPWAIARTTSYQMNNVHFGNHRTQFTGRARALYMPYFMLLGGIIALGAAIFGVVYLSIDPEAMAYAYGPYGINDITPFITIGIGYVAFIIGVFLVQSFFEAAVARWFFGNMSFRNIRMRSVLQGTALFSVRLVNIGLLLVTLGVAYAWTHVRMLRLTINAVQFSGPAELDTLVQDTMPAPKRGEGLLEALDIDLAL